MDIEIEGPHEYLLDCPWCSRKERHQHWIGRLAIAPTVETSGVSEDDAFNGVVIMALRWMADRIQQGYEYELPEQVYGYWFQRRPAHISNAYDIIAPC